MRIQRRTGCGGHAVLGSCCCGVIRFGVTGAGHCACRDSGMEKGLKADLKPAAIDAVEVPDAGFNSDLHASAEYRAHMVKVMAKRAVAAMLES